MERLTHKARYEAGYKANKNVHDWECVDKLGQLEALEEQGKLLKLPCAVGDTVYSFSFVKVLTLHVDSFVIYADRIDARLVSDMEEYKSSKVDLCIADFGKKWFTTREEAEAALKDYFMS